LSGITKTQPVALERCRDRQANTRVPARRLDDRPARGELPFALGLLDHPQADPVLDAAARVQELELGKQPRLDVAGNPLQAYEWSAADEIENGRKVIAHPGP
jgi:hypothetical protein